MRISDWSSDVCSSDLGWVGVINPAFAGGSGEGLVDQANPAYVKFSWERLQPRARRSEAGWEKLAAEAAPTRGARGHQRLMAASILADVLVPHLGVGRDPVAQHLDAALVGQVDDLDAVLAQPLDPAVEVHRLATHHRAERSEARRAGNGGGSTSS